MKQMLSANNHACPACKAPLCFLCMFEHKRCKLCKLNEGRIESEVVALTGAVKKVVGEFEGASPQAPPQAQQATLPAAATEEESGPPASEVPTGTATMKRVTSNMTCPAICSYLCILLT